MNLGFYKKSKKYDVYFVLICCKSFKYPFQCNNHYIKNKRRKLQLDFAQFRKGPSTCFDSTLPLRFTSIRNRVLLNLEKGVLPFNFHAPSSPIALSFL